jgi:hypothetical protein
MQRLLDTQNRLLHSVDLTKKRYLFDKINWNSRLIAITGQRGVGKTTILLQRIKESQNLQEHLYISADSLFIYKLSLFEIALNFRNEGGIFLYIDEVHKYPNWSGEIKHIYDTIPDLKVIFTGSSVIDILKNYGDLSRRAIHYNLHGLSFREYLLFETGEDFPAITIDNIINHQVKIKISNPLSQFKIYLQKGYYPFYLEGDFEIKLMNVINAVLEVDLAQYFDLKASTIGKLKKLLQIIAESVPFKPNISKIADLTDISRSLLLDYFHYLEKGGLIKMIHQNTKGIQGLGKPEKIYLNNTNLCHVLINQMDANIGNIRETFFMSQTAINHKVELPKKGDFEIEGNIFEVGGKNKTKKQITGLENAYLVKDDIEIGYQETVPLWLFGFLY